MTGTGTSSDPYIIATCDDWVLFWNTYGYETRSSEEDTLYGRLGNDLDFSDYDYSGYIQTLAMNSYIDFDGNGYTVKNISGTIAARAYGVLYGNTYFNLYNITFDGANIIRASGSSLASAYFIAVGTSSAVSNIVIKNSIFYTPNNLFILGFLGSATSTTVTAYNIAIINNSISTTTTASNSAGVVYVNTKTIFKNCYLSDNTIKSLTSAAATVYAFWINYYYYSTLLNCFERDTYINYAGNIYNFYETGSSSTVNLVCCYSANTYTNCTGTIYPFNHSSSIYSSFFDKTLCEESGVTLDSTSEAADYGITTEELQSESFLRGKGWAI